MEKEIQGVTGIADMILSVILLMVGLVFATVLIILVAFCLWLISQFPIPCLGLLILIILFTRRHDKQNR